MREEETDEQLRLELEAKRTRLESEKDKLIAQLDRAEVSGHLLTGWKDPKTAMAQATRLWERSIKIGAPIGPVIDAEVARVLDGQSTTVVEYVQQHSVAAIFRWMAQWAHVAFPRIETSHTYAAALMCTDVYRDTLVDLELQWGAFEVVVPSGLIRVLETELRAFNIERIRVVAINGEAQLICACAEGFAIFRVGSVGSSLVDVLLADVPIEEFPEEFPEECTDPRIMRAVKLCQRLVAGLLLAMQHTSNFRSRLVGGSHAKGAKRDDPEHRVVFVGAPLKVDARPAVNAFLETGSFGRGKHSPPGVQVLVRGHYKRQTIGVGRVGRKVVWIEPYWRGPEDAPILTRPRHVGPQTAKRP